VLGFALTVSSPEYSIVERDGQTIHFQKAASEEVMTCVRGHAEIYIEVSGIDALWDHVEAFKNRYRIRDLFDRDYGIIVFHIGDPNDCLVFCTRAHIQSKAQYRQLTTSFQPPAGRSSRLHHPG
jgi:hypothetical protein